MMTKDINMTLTLCTHLSPVLINSNAILTFLNIYKTKNKVVNRMYIKEWCNSLIQCKEKVLLVNEKDLRTYLFLLYLCF